MQLQLEIIWAIRNETGQDYPLAIRLSACDHMPGRITIHDSVNAARAFEMAGIDLPDISGGFCIYKNPESAEQDYSSALLDAIKAVVHVPVILTGGVIDAAAQALV